MNMIFGIVIVAALVFCWWVGDDEIFMDWE